MALGLMWNNVSFADSISKYEVAGAKLKKSILKSEKIENDSIIFCYSLDCNNNFLGFSDLWYLGCKFSNKHTTVPLAIANTGSLNFIGKSRPLWYAGLPSLL